MSTRSFDLFYLNLIENILGLLSEKILKAFPLFQQDNFSKQYLDIYSKIVLQESQKSYQSNFSTALRELSNFLISKSPEFRCESSGSSLSKSDAASPRVYEKINTAKGYFAHPKGLLDEILEEDQPLPSIRNHSQQRRVRESQTKSPKKSNLKSSGKEDIIGKYAKMTEKFLGRPKKEENLYFNNGIFFHVP